MEEPLLSGKRGNGERESPISTGYEYIGRSAYLFPTASLVGQVSVDEIRSAAAIPPSDHYPPSHPQPPQYPPLSSEDIGYHRYHGSPGGAIADMRRQVLDEVEIRELLLDHVGHHFCWGSRPAKTWKIHAVEDCNVYVGTLETFIEERNAVIEKEPNLGGKFDEKEKLPEPGLWELDLRSEFPVLFAPHKELKTEIPHSEATEKCPGCMGRGQLLCPSCNADNEEPGFYKQNQSMQCPACYGRGLIAHKDGSDTICVKCNGKGNVPCATCGSRGLIQCETCKGGGSLLVHKVAVINWKTLTTRKVSATSGAASVPADVFHRAQGIQLCNTQAYQCTPAYFADSIFLNRFSSEVIAERAQVPPAAHAICERHIISVVPVTRVTMTHGNRSFSFYIIGYSREIYLKDYPSRFCCGLCPCLEWLKF